MSTDETPVTWRKSSYSQNGDCVELFFNETSVVVRDSKDSLEHTLHFRLTNWAAFIERIKSAKL
jgi:hypothetical protein